MAWTQPYVPYDPDPEKQYELWKRAWGEKQKQMEWRTKLMAVTLIFFILAMFLMLLKILLVSL